MDGIENKSSLRQGFVGHVKDVVEYERFLKMGETREQPEGEGAGERFLQEGYGFLRKLRGKCGEDMRCLTSYVQPTLSTEIHQDFCANGGAPRISPAVSFRTRCLRNVSRRPCALPLRRTPAIHFKKIHTEILSRLGD